MDAGAIAGLNVVRIINGLKVMSLKLKPLLETLTSGERTLITEC